MLNLSHNHTILKDKLGSPALLSPGDTVSTSYTGSLCCRLCCCRFMLLDAVCLFTIMYSVLSAVYGPLRGLVRARMCYLPSELMHSLSWGLGWFLAFQKEPATFNKNNFPHCRGEDFYLFIIGIGQYFKCSKLLEAWLPKRHVWGRVNVFQ